MKAFLLWLALAIGVNAATINVTSYGTHDGLTDVDVQAAIDASSSGDTIQMAAGSATWTHVVTLSAGRTLAGAGMASTVITCDTGIATNTLMFGDNCRVTAMTLNSRDSALLQDASGAPYSLLYGGQAQSFRVDHVHVGNVIRRGFLIEGNGSGAHGYGLADHCEFYAHSYPGKGDGAFQLAGVQGGENNAPPTENTSTGTYHNDPGAGSANMVFIEDSVFWQDAQGDSSLETYQGGKVCVRYCTMTNFFLGVHGRDSSIRSGHWIEVYHNTDAFDLGTDSQPFVVSRGGSGIVWSNTVTSTTSHANTIDLQNYRAAGVLAVDQADYTQRFGYNGGQLDGHSPYDGNTAVSTGSGTHSGSNGAATLTDSGKSWGTDAFKGNGTYSTADNLQTAFIWNRTDGSGGRVTANTATTVTATLSGGTRNNWNTGDSYVITFGYPGLDQNGWTGPTSFAGGTYSTQTLRPWYQWSNTYNGVAGLTFSVDFLDSGHTTIAQPQADYFIQANREYYDNTAMPGYTPYTYPHPLQGAAGSVPGAMSGKATLGGKATIQ